MLLATQRALPLSWVWSLQVVQQLLNEAKRLCGDGLTLNLRCSVLDVNLAAQTVKIDADGAISTASYDLLVAADGVNSRIREAMAEQVGKLGHDVYI